MDKFFPVQYANKLAIALEKFEWSPVVRLAEVISTAWRDGHQIFFCGNGGSGGNANHFANDFVYGVSPGNYGGIKATSLCANPSVLTCIANDVSYDDVFAYQLGVFGCAGDVCIVLSGSGNSPNIIKVVQQAKGMGIHTSAILGYSGGKCKDLVDIPIHFPVEDMQISEDLQQVVGHMLMRMLKDGWVPSVEQKGIK